MAVTGTSLSIPATNARLSEILTPGRWRNPYSCSSTHDGFRQRIVFHCCARLLRLDSIWHQFDGGLPTIRPSESSFCHQFDGGQTGSRCAAQQRDTLLVASASSNTNAGQQALNLLNKTVSNRASSHASVTEINTDNLVEGRHRLLMRRALEAKASIDMKIFKIHPFPSL
jgi:hypothetical protein